MATIKTTIKRRNGTGWDELRPKTEVDQITDFDANVPDVINDLTNVNAPSPSNGQALVWDNTTSKWVPGTVTTDISGKLSKYTWQPGIVYWHNGGTDAGFRNILKVTSSSLSTGGILYVDGTSGSVVVNARFEILVNHYQDIVVKSLSSGYTQVKIKVQTGTNDEFNLLIARDRNDTNTTTITATFIPYDQNATVTTYTNNPAVSYSSVTLTHTTIAFSENISATGGSTGKLFVEGSQVWHSGNDGSGSGLDADTLDTYHASDFVAVTGDTMTGNLSIENGGPNLTLKDTTDSDDITLHFKNNANTVVGAITTAGNQLNIETSFTNGLEIDAAKTIISGGNVGIGTTSPSSKLHILSADPILTIQDTETTGASSDARLRLAESTTGNVIDQYWDIKKEGDNLKLQNKYGTTVYDRFTINGTNGNVGIGTTSPTGKLDVRQGYFFALITGADVNASTLTNNSRKYTRIGMPHYTNAQEPVSLITGDSDGTNNLVHIGGGTSAGNAATQIHLKTSSNATTTIGTTRLFVGSNGNVGIGTTSPSQKLEVSGNIRATSSLLAGANLYLNDDNTATDTSIYFGDAASDTAHRLFFDDSDQHFRFSDSLTTSGNVRSTGWMWASGNLHTNGNLYLNYDNTAGNSYVFFGDAGSDAEHYLQFSDATQKFTLTDDLIVTGDVTVNGSFTMVDTNTQTTEQWSVTNDGTGPAVIINQKGSQPVMRVQDDSSTVFEIVDGGNTHISNAKELTFLMNGQSYGSSLYVDSSDNTLLNARGGAGKTLTLRTYSGSGWNTGLVMDDAGNVGIGTTSPETKLKVLDTVNYTSPTLGTNSGSFSVIKTDSAADQVGDYGLLMGISGSGWSWLQAQRVDGTATAYALNLQPSGGNVGIGTTSPSQKLEVNGNINANELHLNDTNTKLVEGGGNSLRIQTNSGYVDVGPRNTSWSHFITDRSKFYFGTGIDVDGNIRAYSNNTTQIEGSTGYIYELGNRVLTEASDVLQSYEFSPGSSNGSRRFVRLFTLNGFNNSSGAFADVILSGSGDYGDFDRTALRIMAGERGNAVTVDVYSLNSEDTSDAPIIYYKSTGTANSFEIWAQLADYNYQHRLSVLAKQGGFTVNLDSITTTTPSGLNTVTQKTLWHSGNDGTGSGLSADNLRGYLPSETASANSIAKRNGDGDLTVTDLHASKVLSENVTTTPDKIGNIKIARLHGTTTAISNINNLDTFILSKTDGGYGSGTKPSGTHNGFGVISLQTHTDNYYTQLGLDTNQNALWIRSANGTTSYGSWQRAFADNYHPNADKLTTARTIAGVSFDGTANISLNNNAITNGAGYTTNTGTVTNVTVGTGLDVTNGTTTPSITLDLSEFTSMTDDINGLADELILLDGGAERRKTISSIKLSQFNNDAGWSSRRPVTAGGNSLASSESLDFIAGTGITISESGGDVTISASSSGEPEWEYVTKVSGANPLTYSGMDALSNYEYKFVVEVVTTAEDNSNPYIRINNDSTTGETSYQYTRVQQTTLTGETETHNGNANSNLIYTGLALSSYSNGGTSVSTVHNAEFIYTISPYSSSPGIYTGIVDGWGSTHYSSQSGTAYDGMVQSRFTGRKRSIYQTEANRIDYYHDITAGTTDYSEMRVYRRPKK